MGDVGLTERQKKWFATVRANFEAQTGKPVEAWVAILGGCPETGPKKQAAWLKEHHGIGVNHAAYILDCAGSKDGQPGWDDPEALRAALWKDAGSLAVLEAIERVAAGVDGVVTGQRKGYTAWSRAVQFAAARPLRGGRAVLGLKLDPDTSPRLSASARRESWSERLTSVIELDLTDAAHPDIAALFVAASLNS